MVRVIDKKGMIAKEVVTLVVAVLGIGIVLLITTDLFAGIRGEQEDEKAQNIIEQVDGKVKALADGESTELTIQGLDGWFLDGFGESERYIPDKCFYESCICVCKAAKVKFGRINLGEVVANACQERGFCRETDKETVNIFSMVLVPKTTFAPQSIKQELETEKADGVGLNANFIKLIISKSKDSLEISADLGDLEDE